MSSVIGFSSSCVVKYLDCDTLRSSWEKQYDGYECDMSCVELTVCLPEDWKVNEGDKWNIRELDYDQALIY